MLVVAACGSDTSNSSEEGTVTEPEETEEVTSTGEEEQEEQEESADNNESEENEKLTKIGDKKHDSRLDATVELMEIAEVNDTIDLSPIKLTIQDIKIIRMSDIKSAQFLNELSYFTDKEIFDYVQIQYEIENTEDMNIRLNSPIEAIVFDTGEQIETFDNDLAYDENFARTLYGEVKNQSMVGIVIQDSDPQDINEIKIITGRIDHGDTSETLVEGQSVSYTIE